MFALQTEVGLAAWLIVILVTVGLVRFIRCFGQEVR